MKKNSMWKKMLFPAICLIVVVVIVLLNNDVTEISHVIRTVNLRYLAYSIILLVIYFLLWPISLCLMAKSRKLNISFLDVFLIGSTEHFFNGITPFSTGGQPFEAFAFKKKGVSYADSTGLLLINFIAFQIVVTVSSIVSFILNYRFLHDNVKGIISLVVIGLIMNTLVLFIFVSIGCFKRVRKLFFRLMYLLSKVKFLKKILRPKLRGFSKFCKDYQIAFKDIMHKKLLFVINVLIKAVTMIVYYMIPFFILKSLGLQIGYEDLFFVSAMTCFSICMTCWIPTPGASGGIEFAFKTLFVAISGMTSALAVSGMLIWRLITYYFLMLISFTAYIIFKAISKQQNIHIDILEAEKELNSLDEESLEENIE